jgi:hypothetical protein
VLERVIKYRPWVCMMCMFELGRHIFWRGAQAIASLWYRERATTGSRGCAWHHTRLSLSPLPIERWPTPVLPLRPPPRRVSARLAH